MSETDAATDDWATDAKIAAKGVAPDVQGYEPQLSTRTAAMREHPPPESNRVFLVRTELVEPAASAGVGRETERSARGGIRTLNPKYSAWCRCRLDYARGVVEAGVAPAGRCV